MGSVYRVVQIKSGQEMKHNALSDALYQAEMFRRIIESRPELSRR